MADLYWVFAPCGLAMGYKMTHEQAEMTIKRHSLYPGEPHWQIVPVGSDVPAVLRSIDARLEAECQARLANLSKSAMFANFSNIENMA
ncbi:TPA: hypothetical protein QDB06_001746 [Burkholderia vietnamiensis]|uniref:hypothetical protein n=1 Tax=Burkholderia vietnamiensis TaxID=60552 RepID=UPI00158D6CA2|nr:hypothetical protein [Burkholderia vietnamiensis]MCA7958049.1 hypothetical protein [Burkholderia multivorans]HDR9159705.1 hypothetical protein [Burkholderia vietnamiensis]HDR9181192.1 hypothetical protein [Burkholderia vietnamiensis]